MAKSDLIDVYYVGCRRNPDYDGICMVTPTLSVALETMKDCVNLWKDKEWKDVKEFYIKVIQENVVEHLISNNCNISMEEAKDIAEKHEFTLEEIGWNHWLGEI